ncbi:MAG: monovalent cation/H+ antiporter complex subunit F [Candidatus Marinimicrobia bacterium]|nr:monovalent cation/H+ antiporter complex subunit F [Candidatus Neomarinimicrobiota bacterium]
MVNIIYQIAGAIALAAILLAFVRMIKGPTAADRVVALDVMTIISISLIIFLAATLQRVIYIDIAMVYGLISFVGVVAIARYLERGI